MNKKLMIYGIISLLALSSAHAVRVGVVVEFPDETIHTQCIQADESDNGYELVNDVDVGLVWGGPHSLYGHSLCKINDVGTEPTATGCEFAGEYWGFWIIPSGQSTWKNMPVGYDAGDKCWNRELGSWSGHYCAVEGDVLGFIFGGWGTKLSERVDFEDICPTAGGGIGKKILPVMGLSILPAQPNNIEPVRIKVTDNKTEDPVKYAIVEVFDSQPGITSPLFKAESNKSGEVEFEITKVGEYTLRITGTKYPHIYEKLTVKPTTTTTSTTTTSTTTTTTYTTTTTMYNPPHFLIKTTTTQKTTTTLEQTADAKMPAVIGHATRADAKAGGMLEAIIGWLSELFG